MMKKIEFLRELENSLKGKLAEADLDEILSDYNDIFEDGLLDNKDEDEISDSIGSPACISKAIIDESTADTIYTLAPVGPDTSNLASMSKRFLAYFIDTAVITFILIVLTMTAYTTGIGFSQTTMTESSTSNPGGIDYTQRITLDKDKSISNIKLYKDREKIFSGNKPDFDAYMQNHIDIKINSVQTVEKARSTAQNSFGPRSLLTPFLILIPYTLLFMALGFANIITAFELWLFKGYTLGKWLTKIRVVRLDDRKITFWDAMLRDILLKFGATLITSGLLNLGSFILGCVTPDHKTIHDLAAKTKVINIEG